MLRACEGMPVILDRYVPKAEPRHPSVQRWWPCVLKHLGELEEGTPTYYVIGGTVRVHPDVFDRIFSRISRIPSR